MKVILLLFALVILQPVFADQFIPINEDGPEIKTINVDVGETLIFGNDDSSGHTITSGNVHTGPDGQFDSGAIHPGDTWSIVFDKPKHYEWFDLIFPWINGVIIVGNAPPEEIPETSPQKHDPLLEKIELLEFENERLQDKVDELERTIKELEAIIHNLRLLAFEQMQVIHKWVVQR